MKNIAVKVDNTAGDIGLLKAEEWNGLYDEVKNAIIGVGTTLSAGDSSQLLKAIKGASSVGVKVDGGSTANSVKVVNAANIPDTEPLVDGAVYMFKAVANNTGPVSLSVDGRVSKPLVTYATAGNLIAGTIETGELYNAVWDNTLDKFRLLSFSKSADSYGPDKANPSIRMGSSKTDANFDGVEYSDGTNTYKFYADQSTADGAVDEPILEFDKGSKFEYRGDAVALQKDVTAAITAVSTGVAADSAKLGGKPAADYRLKTDSDFGTQTITTSGMIEFKSATGLQRATLDNNRLQLWQYTTAGDAATASRLDINVIDTVDSNMYITPSYNGVNGASLYYKKSDGFWTVNGSKPMADTGYYPRTTHNSGHLVGSYNNVGSSAGKTSPIYTIGSNYNPNEDDLNNMYGMGYTTADAPWFATDLDILPANSNWGMYVASFGISKIFLNGNNGYVYAKGTKIGTKLQYSLSRNNGMIYYSVDAADTGSYMDLNLYDDATAFYLQPGTRTIGVESIIGHPGIRYKYDTKVWSIGGSEILTTASGPFREITDLNFTSVNVASPTKGLKLYDNKIQFLHSGDNVADKIEFIGSSTTPQLYISVKNKLVMRFDERGTRYYGRISADPANPVDTINLVENIGTYISAGALPDGGRTLSLDEGGVPVVNLSVTFSIYNAGYFGQTVARDSNILHTHGGEEVGRISATRSIRKYIYSTTPDDSDIREIAYEANIMSSDGALYFYPNAHGDAQISPEKVSAFRNEHLYLGSGVNLGRMAHNSGHLVGSYNSVGSNGGKTSPIYTIGSAYNPNEDDLGNMYGIGYTTADAPWFATDLDVLDTGSTWGMYLASGGLSRIFLNATNGYVYAKGTKVGTKLHYSLSRDNGMVYYSVDAADTGAYMSFNMYDDATSFLLQPGTRTIGVNSGSGHPGIRYIYATKVWSMGGSEILTKANDQGHVNTTYISGTVLNSTTASVEKKWEIKGLFEGLIVVQTLGTTYTFMVNAEHLATSATITQSSDLYDEKGTHLGYMSWSYFGGNTYIHLYLTQSGTSNGLRNIMLAGALDQADLSVYVGTNI